MKAVVLTQVQHIQYGTHVFIIHNKEGTVRFIINSHRIKQKLVRNPYPLPRIGGNIQYMERLQYTTALYIKMGYYTTGLSHAIQDMTVIDTEFGKFR